MLPNLRRKTDPLVKRALDFAKFAHEGQLRRYTDAPYWTHCEDVAELVASVTDDREMIAAAILHDTLEDTPTRVTDLIAHFGERVTKLVIELTDVFDGPPHGNRAERKGKERARLALATPEAKTIKLADLIDNTKTITFYDPKFAKTYLKEKAALLEVLTEGDALLWEVASDQVREGTSE